jgi:hypothetical protein
VALVKNAFRTTLGRRVLSKEEMRTFVIETEAALNCRPLTYVSTEEDGLLPLRPADFINQYADFLMLPSFDEDKEPRDKKATELLRQWEAQQATQDYFWNRWAHEYLLMLREKAGWLHKAKKSEVTSLPHVGQVVLLEEPMKPRIQWSLARVEELETRAGNVRNVKLRMPNGHVWSRPLKLVYPLEASVDNENSHVGSQLDTPTDHVALTDHVAPDDHVAPNDHVAPRAPEGISVTTSERVVYALWCCERYSCQLIKGDTKGVFQLPMNVTGQQYGCNMACRGMVDIDPVQVVCSPWLPTEWPSWLRPTAISLLLLIIGILLGWKGGATWRAITNCCRRARLRLRAHQEDDEEGQELQLRENGPRVRFRPEETDGSIDKTRRDKRRARSGVHDDGPSTSGVTTTAPHCSVAETTIGPPLVSTKEKIEAGFARAEARYARMLDGTQVAAVAIIAILATCADVASAEVTGTLCSGCSVSCTSHGIAAQMNEGISKTEICCRGDQCASPERNDRWEYRLPEEIFANDYTCEGRTWDAKRGGSNFTIRCHAVDECKLIECRFCVDVVTNPA